MVACNDFQGKDWRKGSERTQEVQVDQTLLPLVGSGILATYGSSDQDQPLCLVGWTSRENLKQ